MMMPEGCVGKHCYRACYQDEVLIYACCTTKKYQVKTEIVLEILHCM